MDINLILAEVYVTLPEAREFDIRVQLESLLAKIGRKGLETAVSITATLPATTEGDPLLRTTGQAYNYYPTAKCLILPSYLNNGFQFWKGTTQLLPATKEEWLAGTMPDNTYFATGTGELYLSMTLAASDVIKAYGKITSITVDILPETYRMYLVYGILAGMYEHIVKNADSAVLYTNRMNEQWRLVSGTSQTSPKPRPNSLFKARK